MKAAQEWLDQHPETERVKLSDGDVHYLTMQKAKIDVMPARNGQPEKEGVRFLVLENDVAKEFFTASRDLIKHLSRFENGDTFTVQAKKKYTDGGGEFTEYVVVGEGEEIVNTEGTPEAIPPEFHGQE